MNVKNKLVGAAVALCAASLLTIAPITTNAAKKVSCKLASGKVHKYTVAKCDAKGGTVIIVKHKKHAKHQTTKKDDASMQTTTPASTTTTTTTPATTQPAAQ